MKFYQVFVESSNGEYSPMDADLFATELQAAREANALIMTIYDTEHMDSFRPNPKLTGDLLGWTEEMFIRAVGDEIREFNQWWENSGNYYLTVIEKVVYEDEN